VNVRIKAPVPVSVDIVLSGVTLKDIQSILDSMPLVVAAGTPAGMFRTQLRMAEGTLKGVS
jgi:hypothetical protein